MSRRGDQVDVARFDRERVPPDAEVGIAAHLSTTKIETPRVERTGDDSARDGTLAERTAAVRAAVFDREEVATMLLRSHPEGLTTPPTVAIAYHIIRAWVEEEVEFR